MTLSLLFFIWLKSKNRLIETDLTLSNIEALASTEDGGNVICIGSGSLDCPTPHRKVAFIREF
ncbi:NVEALA domain-containing protein [Proteiniphilum sp. X52]|uniref:NVEALA domain-containing protein n=1 Tax=Proteiniphilum sp. X52 TaxID=2382159 RepID=UPI000F09DED1|nr:hypothetical protein D7D25_16285 [Proteiniphilum sp. X52]